MTTQTDPILVTGATGAQGGATAAALLAAGFHIRVLARNPESALARTLAGRGAQVLKGDLADPASIGAAMRGVGGVFSVQVPDSGGGDSERRHGFNLIHAARQAGVRHFVHASVCEAGKHTAFPGWDSGCWSQQYWTDKWDIEEAVRNAGFPYWTVLKPAFMMDNFAPPKEQFMFPHLREGKILSALLPETRVQLIAAADVGAFACAAFEHPTTFNRKNIDLAAEALTMGEVAAILSRVTRKRVDAVSVSPAEALDANLFPGWVQSQRWTNAWGYRADIAALNAYGIALTPFAGWATQHAERIVIGV